MDGRWTGLDGRWTGLDSGNGPGQWKFAKISRTLKNFARTHNVLQSFATLRITQRILQKNKDAAETGLDAAGTGLDAAGTGLDAAWSGLDTAGTGLGPKNPQNLRNVTEFHKFRKN